MIKHDVIDKGYSNGNPDQPEEHAQSSLEHLRNHGEVAINMQNYDKVCDDD